MEICGIKGFFLDLKTGNPISNGKLRNILIHK